MKKAILVLTLQCLITGWSYAGWPINRTPRIEGVITDATTGEPIENVIVSATWLKQVPTPVDMVTRYCGSHTAITDKDGRYKIPAKISIHLLSSFSNLSIGFVHPLYEVRGGSVRKLDARDLRKEHKQYDGRYGIRRSTGGPSGHRFWYDLWVEDHGVILYDVKLMSLEEKYKTDEAAKKFKLAYIFDATQSPQCFWFRDAKEKRLQLNADNIFRKWDELAEKFGIADPKIKNNFHKSKETISNYLKTDRWIWRSYNNTTMELIRGKGWIYGGENED